MSPTTPSLFPNWQTFYEIVGSAAGALTGLQFIVITLIAQTRAVGSKREISAFGTPTVAHFCTALLMSAVMVMPWPEPTALAICLGVCGAAGVAYSIRVVWHARKSTYNPDLEDWLWYTAFPVIAHLILIVAAGLLRFNVTYSLFTVAADTLLFLLLGIHNSWDTVTYIAVKAGNGSSSRGAEQADGEGNVSEENDDNRGQGTNSV